MTSGGLTREAAELLVSTFDAAEAEYIDASLRKVDVRQRYEVDVYCGGTAVRFRAHRRRDESFAWAPVNEADVSAAGRFWRR